MTLNGLGVVLALKSRQRNKKFKPIFPINFKGKDIYEIINIVYDIDISQNNIIFFTTPKLSHNNIPWYKRVLRWFGQVKLAQNFVDEMKYIYQDK